MSRKEMADRPTQTIDFWKALTNKSYSTTSCHFISAARRYNQMCSSCGASEPEKSTEKLTDMMGIHNNYTMKNNIPFRLSVPLLKVSQSVTF